MATRCSGSVADYCETWRNTANATRKCAILARPGCHSGATRPFSGSKGGQIQASGVENVSELRISMRSIWIYGRFGKILAKYVRFWPENAKSRVWYGGMCGEGWLKPYQQNLLDLEEVIAPLSYHALLHPEGWAADSNAPRIPPTPIWMHGCLEDWK